MLASMHNGEILLAPLRNQEAVVSSRMEGTISTLEGILRIDDRSVTWPGATATEGVETNVTSTSAIGLPIA